MFQIFHRSSVCKTEISVLPVLRLDPEQGRLTALRGRSRPRFIRDCFLSIDSSDGSICRCTVGSELPLKTPSWCVLAWVNTCIVPFFYIRSLLFAFIKHSNNMFFSRTSGWLIWAESSANSRVSKHCHISGIRVYMLVNCRIKGKLLVMFSLNSVERSHIVSRFVTYVLSLWSRTNMYNVSMVCLYFPNNLIL